MSAPIIREPQSVWMIWTKHGHRPKFCHANKRKAMREAERLARLHPGNKFLVMQVVAKISVEVERADQISQSVDQSIAALKQLFVEAGASAEEHAQLDAIAAQKESNQ